MIRRLERHWFGPLWSGAVAGEGASASGTLNALWSAAVASSAESETPSGGNEEAGGAAVEQKQGPSGPWTIWFGVGMQ